MRRGVWVVLGLMGLAPVGALAEEAPRQPTEQTQGGSQARAAPAVGGAGQAGTAPAAASAAPTTGAISVFGPVGSEGGGSSTVTQEQAGAAPAADDTDTSGITLEIPKGGVRFPGIEGARQSLANEAGQATGGSGRNVSASPSPWSNVPNEEVFVGTVRTVTRDRLLLEDPNQRIYEFSLGERTRVLGPSGGRLSLQALREGTPVRTVTRSGEFENQVLILQALEQAPAPSR